MDGALTFIHICVDSSQTVLEHHRSFAPFIWQLRFTYSKILHISRICTHRLSFQLRAREVPLSSVHVEDLNTWIVQLVRIVNQPGGPIGLHGHGCSLGSQTPPLHGGGGGGGWVWERDYTWCSAGVVVKGPRPHFPSDMGPGGPIALEI